MVVLSDTDKFVYGIDRKTGSLVWKTELPGYVDSSPAIAGDKVRMMDAIWILLYAFNAASISNFFMHKCVHSSTYALPTFFFFFFFFFVFFVLFY